MDERDRTMATLMALAKDLGDQIILTPSTLMSIERGAKIVWERDSQLPEIIHVKIMKLL